MSAGFVRFMKKSMEIQTFKYYFAQNFCFILSMWANWLMFWSDLIVNKVLHFNPFIIQSNHIVSEDFIQVIFIWIEFIILANVSILLLHWKKKTICTWK